VQSQNWRRYVAPAAFLAAVTIAVVLVRAGLESGGSGTTTVVATTTVLAKRYYRVHAGDTFAVIARKTGVSVKTIERLNPRVKATSLHIGERIRIQ
jgi:LysM repeat protein